LKTSTSSEGPIESANIFSQLDERFKFFLISEQIGVDLLRLDLCGVELEVSIEEMCGLIACSVECPVVDDLSVG